MPPTEADRSGSVTYTAINLGTLRKHSFRPAWGIEGYAGQTFAMLTGSVAVFVGLAVIGFLFGFLRSKRR